MKRKRGRRKVARGCAYTDQNGPKGNCEECGYPGAKEDRLLKEFLQIFLAGRSYLMTGYIQQELLLFGLKPKQEEFFTL